MENLNLPSFDIKVDFTGRFPRVYDTLRRKLVALTPEEWVRQHFVNFLVAHLGYPAPLMANEIGIELNNTRRRCDTVVFDREARPLVIVEYKAPDVTITQDVFDQVVRYNMVLQARYLMVSNGLCHDCVRVDYSAKKVEFLAEIPPYGELV